MTSVHHSLLVLGMGSQMCWVEACKLAGQARAQPLGQRCVQGTCGPKQCCSSSPSLACVKLTAMCRRKM